MHQRMLEVSDAIEQAASALSQGYDREQLYALRVAMRRVRSMLKPIGSQRTREFRKAWGGFAALTNRARDWDVFLLTAAELLPPARYGDFERRHRNPVRASHEAVLELLRTAHWRRHLEEWREYLRHGHGLAAEESAAAAALDRALSKARAALTTALETGDDRAWHKLRIAVKEVRYLAESGEGGAAPDPRLAGVIEQCKLLQSQLGGWHDCVVQLQLLAEMEAALEHGMLSEAIAQRRGQRLAEIERSVAGHPLFGLVENSITRERSPSSSGS